MAGRLRGGSELSPAKSECAVYVQFGDAGTGFILVRESFLRGGFPGDDPSTFVVGFGAVNLSIDPESDQPT